MVLPVDQGLKIIRSRVESPEQLAHRIADVGWMSTARVIKEGPRQAVFAGDLDGTDLIVRTTRLERLKDTPARWSGRTHAMRHWHGTVLLERAGLPAAPPRVLFRGTDDDGVYVETLVAERVVGDSLLQMRETIDASCAEALGRHVAAMLQARVYHRDHKASNLIVRQTDAGPEVVVVDADGVRHSSRRDACERMLMATLVEFLGTGAPPRRTMCFRALHTCLETLGAESRWKDVWRRVAELIAAHGDPTPKDDPGVYDPRVRAGQ